MIQLLLTLFRPFRFFIERMDVDYDQFIEIIRLKLTMDNRRPRRRKKSSDNSLTTQMIGQMITGLAFSVMFFGIKSEFTFFYLMHIIIMVMLAMMIISEFTTILFDTSENSIIQPLPIKGNTLSFARNAHIFIYLTFIAFNISFATIVIGIIKFGIVSGLIFMVSVLLNVMFTLFLANILYLGIMHIASGEQLKNILMYFQIAIAVLFMAGYQFGLNMIDRSQLANMTLPVHWYTFLIPPAVFSGFVEALSTATFDNTHILFVALAVILPIVVTVITSRFLTPVFSRKLLNLENSDRATKVKSNTGKSTLYYRFMEKLFAHKQEEKAAFQLAWRMSGYERLFKQSFFPSLAYVLIIVAMQFFKTHITLAELAKTNRYLIILYALFLISFTLTTSILLGNNKQTEWIFKTLPVNAPADFFKGFIKAIFARFFNPFFLLLSVGIVAFWGIKAIPDIIIAWMAIYLSTLLIFYIQQIEFPFTQPKSAAQGGKNVGKVFGIMILAGALGFVHYYISKWGIYGQLSLIVFYITGIYLTNKIFVYKMVTWDKIEIGNY